MNIDLMITNLEEKLAELKALKKAQEKALDESNKKADAYINLSAMYKDSIGKTIDNSKNPIPFEMGMYVIPNLWYCINEDEEQILYVAVAEGIVSAESFNDMLEKF